MLASVTSPTPGTCRRGPEEQDGSRRTLRWCGEATGAGAGAAPQRTPGHPLMVSGMGLTEARLPWGMMGATSRVNSKQEDAIATRENLPGAKEL